MIDPTLYPVMPVVQIATSITAGTAGTLTLTVTDKQGRVDLVEFQTQVGTAAASTWTAATGTMTVTSFIYNASVTWTGSDVAVIRWRITGFDINDHPNQLLLAGQETFNDGPAGGGAFDDAENILANRIFGL